MQHFATCEKIGEIFEKIRTLAELPELDRHILALLTTLQTEVRAAYDEFQFSRALTLIQLFVTDLSNFYLDVAKDRLYISAPDEFRRRSCQTVLDETVRSLAVLLAPMTPHLSEDIWQNLPYPVSGAKSVFQARLFSQTHPFFPYAAPHFPYI